MAEWANLETMLALWFRWLTMMISEGELAFAIFYSAKSFQGRADMLAAAIEHTARDAEEAAWAADLLERALAYNTCRNQLAHGFFNWLHQDSEPAIVPGKNWWRAEGVTVEQIENARENFAKLRTIAYRSLRDRHNPETLPKYREQLAELPSEPYSSELSRKQKGRLRQLQAALRKKKPPQ